MFLIEEGSDLLNCHLLFQNFFNKILLDYLIILIYKRSGNVVYNSTYGFSIYSEIRWKKTETTEDSGEFIPSSGDEEELKKKRLQS